MKTINSSDARFFNRVNADAVIRLGPGGDFVQEFVPLADEPGALLEVFGLSSGIGSGDENRLDGCVSMAAGEVVGIGGALADVAGRLMDRLSVVARAVGLLSTADSMLERQQMALFRMRHLASTAAEKLKVDVQSKSGRSAGQNVGVSSGFARKAGSEKVGSSTEGAEAGMFGPASGTALKLAFGRQSGSVCSSTGEVVGLSLGEHFEEGALGSSGRLEAEVAGREVGRELDGGVDVGNALGGSGGVKGIERAHDYELDTQAIEDSATDPRLARSQGVFADDAGAGRRNRRQQGHGVRARRGADQEKRARARAQQGTLFVDC